MKTSEYYAKIVYIGMFVMFCGLGICFVGIIFTHVFTWLLGLGVVTFGIPIGIFGYVKWIPLFYQQQIEERKKK